MIPKGDALLETILETRDKVVLRRMSPLEVLCKQKIVKPYRSLGTGHDPRCLDVLFESAVISYYDGFGTQSSLNGSHSDPLGV